MSNLIVTMTDGKKRYTVDFIVGITNSYILWDNLENKTIDSTNESGITIFSSKLDDKCYIMNLEYEDDLRYQHEISLL